MDEIKDSFGKEIKRGYMAFSFIGMSGSGCTQHLAKAKIAYNGASYTLKTKLAWRFGTFARGLWLDKVFSGAGKPCFCKMITEKQYEGFPVDTTALIFDKDDFKKICQTGKKG